MAAATAVHMVVMVATADMEAVTVVMAVMVDMGTTTAKEYSNLAVTIMPICK